MTEEQPATAPEVVENESQEETQAEIKITDDGKVTKHIIKEGYGPKPRRGQKVTVHYTGTLTDGTKFDSSVDRNKPFMFQVGKGVITGWSIGVMSMKVGEKSMFTMTHEYAYGLHGSPPVIPPMVTLKFEIELIRINK